MILKKHTRPRMVQTVAKNKWNSEEINELTKSQMNRKIDGRNSNKSYTGWISMMDQ